MLFLQLLLINISIIMLSPAAYKVLGNQIINSLNPKVRIYNVFSALFSIFFAVVYVFGEFLNC